MLKTKSLTAMVVASAGLLAGCTSDNGMRTSPVANYTTNVSAGLKESHFGDDMFNLQVPYTDLGKDGIRVWGDIRPDYTVTLADGSSIDKARLFDYWSLRTDEISLRVLPNRKEAIHSRLDGLVRGFMKADDIDALRTDIGYQMPKMPKGERVANVGEPKFNVFEIEFPDGKSVAYAGHEESGRRVLSLQDDTENKEFRLNQGRVELRGDIYVEVMLKIPEIEKTGVTPGNTVNATKVEKPVMVGPPAPASLISP